MVKFKSRNYKFAWSIEADASLSAYQKQCASRAIRKTLAEVPTSILKRNLSVQPTYLLSVRFVSKARIKKMNCEFRSQDKPTDVLSFGQLPDKTPVPELSLGDLILCQPIIEQNAKRFEVSLSEEVHRMLTHGILHLFGFEHEHSPKEAKKMFRLQEKIVTGKHPTREWLE